MMKKNYSRPVSAFAELGLKQTLESAFKEIASLYTCDEIPWVIRYSGGKGSTVALQLV